MKNEGNTHGYFKNAFATLQTGELFWTTNRK